jgi:hypothetical protein
LLCVDPFGAKEEGTTESGTAVEGAEEEVTKAGASPPGVEIEQPAPTGAPTETSKSVEGEPVAEKRIPDRARTADYQTPDRSPLTRLPYGQCCGPDREREPERARAEAAVARAEAAAHQRGP